MREARAGGPGAAAATADSVLPQQPGAMRTTQHLEGGGWVLGTEELLLEALVLLQTL